MDAARKLAERVIMEQQAKEKAASPATPPSKPKSKPKPAPVVKAEAKPPASKAKSRPSIKISKRVPAAPPKPKATVSIAPMPGQRSKLEKAVATGLEMQPISQAAPREERADFNSAGRPDAGAEPGAIPMPAAEYGVVEPLEAVPGTLAEVNADLADQAIENAGETYLAPEPLEDEAMWTEDELAAIRAVITPEAVAPVANTGDEEEPAAKQLAGEPVEPGLMLTEAPAPHGLEDSGRMAAETVAQEIIENFQELEPTEKHEAIAMLEALSTKAQEILDRRIEGGGNAPAAEKELVAMVELYLEKVHIEPTGKKVAIMVQLLAQEAFAGQELPSTEIDESEGTHERKTGLQYLLQQLANLAKRQQPHSQLGWLACHLFAPIIEPAA